MNRHIVLSRKWLADNDSVTLQELTDNRSEAVTESAAAQAAAEAAHTTAKLAAEAAEHQLTLYFDNSGENEQEYTEALLVSQAESIGLKGALNVLDKWQCNNNQIQNILKVSLAELADPTCATLTKGQAERIGYVLSIHSALRTIFYKPENVYGFMSMPNNNPYFEGRTPLDTISTGSFGALYKVLKHIDTLGRGYE